MKKRIRKISFFSLMLGIILLTGCDTDEERKAAAKWRKQAEEDAVLYIQEKYNVMAEVVESETVRVSGLFGSEPTSETIVGMRCEDRDFNVWIDAENPRFVVTDTYQRQEITRAFSQMVEGVLADALCNVRYSLGRKSETKDCDSFFHGYFDGTNLNEILTEYSILCQVDIIGEADMDDLYSKLTEDIWFHEEACFLFVSYESKEEYNKAAHPSLLGSSLEDYTLENAPHITDALLLKYGEVENYDLSMGQCGDFYYLCPDQSAFEYTIIPRNDTVSVTNWNGRGMLDAAGFSEAYFVDGLVGSKLFVYYPKDKLPMLPVPYRESKLRLAISYSSEDSDSVSYKFGAQKNETDEYVVYSFYNRDYRELSFRFLYDRK